MEIKTITVYIYEHAFDRRKLGTICKTTIGSQKKIAKFKHYMANRCQSCGNQTRSVVFGVLLCLRCRSNSTKITYMIPQCEAKKRGFRNIDHIRYHKGSQNAKLRFLIELSVS